MFKLIVDILEFVTVYATCVDMMTTLLPLRYSDIIVHRLLAVAVGADASYPELLDKQKSQALCYNLNYRHRMAQYAGRASVGLHTQVLATPTTWLTTGVCVSRLAHAGTRDTLTHRMAQYAGRASVGLHTQVAHPKLAGAQNIAT